MTSPITIEILREIKENTNLENDWEFDDIVLERYSPDYSPERIARVLWLLANDHLVYGSYVDHEPRKYNESLFPGANYAEERSTCRAATGKWNLRTTPRDSHETNKDTGRGGFLGQDDGRGTDDDDTCIAIDDDPVVLPDQMAGITRTHHRRYIQASCNDGRMRCFATHISDKPREHTLLKLQHVSR